ncbi:MAG: DEAD/DEAH box helicase [Caldilineaceae bacterium]|nr:DEAD/DEAH box helicase [Caldilineaceae bacterium]
MNPFYRLAPFLQDYIYRQRWEQLRPVQVDALQAILDTPNHVLITSGTASGKTEAALLPILTQLDQNPAATIGVIYIGPLKALINDQFERLQSILEETGIPVQSWHGDITQSKKSRFLKQAQGLLQITPESLEAMLMNRHTELGRLFGDLRFVVIDEVHAFINSDRGRQVLCQLQRLARYQATPARRIGLSATLGEPEVAMQWLAGGTDLAITLIRDQQQERKLELGLEFFLLPKEKEEEKEDPEENTQSEPIEAAELLPTALATATEEAEHYPLDFHQHLYALTKRAHKTLIFANKRNNVEKITATLRNLAATNRTPDFYHAHHGNVSAVLREEAENAMRDPESKACTAATLTLELGIDIGNLDQVLQIDATNSVASFVQRLGRAGRRGGAARMFFYNCRQIPNEPRPLGDLLPWNLLQTIAIIQLYLEERWVEPPQIPRYPFSLLYHQSMSILKANTELSPPQLAERVLSLAPFAAVTQEHYRDLLRHLVAIEQLAQMETGTLIIGLKGEKIVNHYHFYATFQAQPDFQVLANSREIGSIPTEPEVGTTIGLAGYTWRVLEINQEKRIIYVEPAKGKAETDWSGGSIEIHTRIVQRIRKILEEESTYGFLQKQALTQLTWARQLARNSGVVAQSILPLSGDRYLILPWQGSRVVLTQMQLLAATGYTVARSDSPFYYEIKSSGGIEEIKAQFAQLATTPPDPLLLARRLARVDLERHKYDRYIPDHLLQQAYSQDFLDVAAAAQSFQQLATA